MAAALDASTRRSAGKPRVGRKARGQTTGLTPAAQRHERIDAGRVAVAPRHSQSVAADETSISDREPRRLTTGEPCLLATVAGRATCRARARPAQLFEVEPAHLAVIEGHLNVGVTVDGDSSDIDRRLSAHPQSLALACSGSSPALSSLRTCGGCWLWSSSGWQLASSFALRGRPAPADHGGRWCSSF